MQYSKQGHHSFHLAQTTAESASQSAIPAVILQVLGSLILI